MSRVLLILSISVLSTPALAAPSGGEYALVAQEIGIGQRVSGGPYTLEGIGGTPGTPGIEGGAYALHGGFDFGAASGPVTSTGSRPTRISLLGPSPNPATTGASFRLELPEAGHVRAEIYSVSGRRVSVVVDRGFEAGRHDLTWGARDESGRGVSSGVYFLRVETSTVRLSRRLVLLER